MQNNKRYWLRGGIIGGLFYLLFGIGIIPIPFIGFLLYTPLMAISLLYGSEIILPAGIIFGFIIGSLFGYLYGKIKSRKQ